MSFDDLWNDSRMLPMMMAFCVIILIIALPIGILNGKKANREIYGEDNDDPIKKCENAKVLAKTSEPHPLTQTLQINKVLFETPDQERIELAIRDIDCYSKMIVGDIGTLSYRGKLFISFERSL